MNHRHALLLAGSLFLCAACTKVPQATDQHVVSLVQERITKRVHWNQSTEEDAKVNCLIEQLLESEVQLGCAVQIALLKNPKIQATFEELGIAQADLVQAGLFQNPIFGGFVRYPSKRSFATNSELSFSQGFMDIFLIPLRKKVKEAELEQAELNVTKIVLDLAFDVQETYYKLQAEQARFAHLKQLVKVTRARMAIAQKQHKAGNINDLECQSHINSYLESKLMLERSQIQIASLQEALASLLGLRTQKALHIPSELPQPITEEISQEKMEQLALTQRVDIAHARLEAKRIRQLVTTKQWWAYTDSAVGISGEKDTDGASVLGPTVTLALPFFDHGQADRARLLAMLKQSEHQLQALEIDALSHVRRSFKELQLNKQQVSLYRNELLPLQSKIVNTSQKMYNVMGLSVYKLLQNKEKAIETEIEYTMALRDYWLTKVALDRAVGGIVVK